MEQIIPGIPNWVVQLLLPVVIPILGGVGVGLLAKLPEPWGRIVTDILDYLRNNASKADRENAEKEAEAAVLAAEQMVKPGQAINDDDQRDRNRAAFANAEAILRGKTAAAKQEELKPQIEAALARLKGRKQIK